MLEKYGETDSSSPKKMTLYANLNLNQKVLVNGKYLFELKFD